MIKGLYGFMSACALIMSIALIPEYVGIIPGAMIFLCGGLFIYLITKILEEEQKSGGESPQDPLASRSWTRVDPGLLKGSQMLEFANLFHQMGFSKPQTKKARLKHRVFFFGRTGSQVTDQVASVWSSFWVQALMIYINIKCCFVCESCYNVYTIIRG